MSKRIRNTNKLKNEIIINRIRIFLIAALMVIIFYPPYLQGLFFEKHILPTQIFVFILFIIFLIYKLLKKDYTFFKTPIEYISLGFVIVYFMAIFVAVHTRSAIIEWLKYCMYFAVFYMITDLADNLKTKLLFLWTIVISAVGVSIIGLDAALGGKLVGILNKFFNVIGVQGNLFFGLFVDNRIHSTLQYPNALASYLMAVFIITVGLLMVYNKWWQKIICRSFAFILFITFMLTQSRGAQLLFPVVVIILLIASPKCNRIKVATHVLLLVIPAGIISLLISSCLLSDTLNQKAVLFLLIIILATVFISLVIRFLGNFLQKINWRIYVSIILTFIIASVVALNILVNSSAPAELSLIDSKENKSISISKDVILKPNKEYILKFEANGNMVEEKPYVFSIRIFNKNIKNILFGESKLLIRQDFTATDGFEEFNILFSTKEDTKLININFLIYYSGTSVKINYASIIDTETGKTVEKIMLKNKYNLDNLISRFENIWLQRSLVSRAIFYKDGFNILKDKLFLGAGGGSWNYLYRQYQSYNYSSSQAHNYPLQLGIETGIVGIFILIALVIILISYYLKYIKSNRNLLENEPYISSRFLNASIFTAIAALYMHSLMDFDFAESSLLLLLWQLIALFNRELIDNSVANSPKINLKRIKYVTNNQSKLTIVIMMVAYITTLYFSLAFVSASSLAMQAYENVINNDIESAIVKMEKAIMLDKFNEKYVLGYNPVSNRTDIKTGLIDILFIKNKKYKKAQENGETISEVDLNNLQKQFSKAALLLKRIEKKADKNLSLTIDLASYSFKVGEIDKGIEYINAAIKYFPFEPSLWHSKIDVYYQLMGMNFNNGEYEKAKEFLFKGLNVINEAKEVNKKNINPFVFNQNTVELLQKMKFLEDNWDNENVNEVNDIIHYSMFDLDVNMDGIPDQWKISNDDFIDVLIYEDDLTVHASGLEYLYTNYPIKLKKGKTYKIEIELKDNVEYISYYITGITPRVLPLEQEGNKYVAELFVENEPNDSQLRVYLRSDCVIENIIVTE